MRYLDLDTRAGHHTADVEKGNVGGLQSKLDAIAREHGNAYIEGIQPVFEPLMAATSTRLGARSAEMPS